METTSAQTKMAIIKNPWIIKPSQQHHRTANMSEFRPHMGAAQTGWALSDPGLTVGFVSVTRLA